MELLITIGVVFSSALLGLFIFFKNPKSATNRIFSLVNLLIGLWSIVIYISLHPPSQESELFWIRSTMFVAIPMSVSFLLLILNFPHDKLIINKKVLTSVLSLMLVTMVTALSPYMFTELKVSVSSVQPVAGPGILLFVITVIGSIITSTIILIRRSIKASGNEKTQLEFILAGIGLMFSLIIATIFIPSVFLGQSALVFLAPVYAFVFLSFVAYAIVRHRLLNIGSIVARAVAYAILVGIIGIFFAVSTVVATALFLQDLTTTQQIFLYTTLTIIVAFTFQPLRWFVQNRTDKIFYKGKYDSQVLISDLTKIMATSLRLDDITKNILKKLLPEIRVSKGAFVLIEKGKVETVESVGFDNKQEFVGTDILSLLEKNKVLYYENENHKGIKQIMRELDATVSVPLKVKEGELGILLLGHKLSGEIYTDQDIKLLEILSPEISIAIQNSKSFEEIRQFSITLQKKVEDATSDLRNANEKLKELDKLKDEFMSIASHELRTPMTAIKSYVWLALHGKSQEKDKKVRVYLDKVFESSERMINMINDMLNVNRIETGRMKLDIIPVSVWKVAEQVKDELSARAAESGLEIVIKKDNIVPLLMSDKDKLIEIFTNLIGNALKFTHKGGKITVTARKMGTMVEVQVTDTGVGIAKENIDKLFKKYGKLNDSYATVSPSTGTGLGLYITHQYLEKMGGKIHITSVLGKGTTFTFSLPIAAGKDLLLHEREEVQPSGVILNPKLAKDPKFLKAVVKAETSQTTKRKS